MTRAEIACEACDGPQSGGESLVFIPGLLPGGPIWLRRECCERRDRLLKIRVQ